MPRHSRVVQLAEQYGASLPSGQADSMLAVLRTVVPRRTAVYVSAPITTGHRYLRWLSTGRRADRREIIEDNLRAATSAVCLTRQVFHGRTVIDPTALEDQPGWEQHHYHRFWLNVIDEFASTLVAVDGWQYSTGCTLEVLYAVENNIELLSEEHRPISAQQVEELTLSADAEYSEFGATGPLPAGSLSLVKEVTDQHRAQAGPQNQ